MVENVNISEIYRNDIELYSSEYLESLHDPDMIYNKSNVFLGLLEYLYKTVLYPIFFKDKGYNNDYDLLDNIFYKIYIPLCYRFGYTPTLLMWASFVHISANYFTELLSGVYHDGSRVNNNTTLTVQKWYDTCKAATFSRAIESNSIGAIFACKSAYNMSDLPKNEQITSDTAQTLSIEDIKSRYEHIENSIPAID